MVSTEKKRPYVSLKHLNVVEILENVNNNGKIGQALPKCIFPVNQVIIKQLI